MKSPPEFRYRIAYDTSMYENQDNTSLTMPAGAAWRFGIGAQQELNEKSSVGVAFEYLMSEDATVPAPALLAGTYTDPEMFFMSVNYSYRF